MKKVAPGTSRLRGTLSDLYVGVGYFGRCRLYLSLNLNLYLSADAVAVHRPGRRRGPLSRFTAPVAIPDADAVAVPHQKFQIIRKYFLIYA